jgi:hypothetical protein
LIPERDEVAQDSGREIVSILGRSTFKIVLPGIGQPREHLPGAFAEEVGADPSAVAVDQFGGHSHVN